MREEVSVYTLAINERDEGREKLEAEEIGLTYESDDSIGKILKKQNTAAWVLSLPKGKSYQLDTGVTYDQEEASEKTEISELFSGGKYNCAAGRVDSGDGCWV